MAFRSILLIKLLRHTSINGAIRHNAISTSVVYHKVTMPIKPKNYKTEEKYVYLEDADTFGTLSGRSTVQSDALEDEGDIREEDLIGNKPLPSQKLTIKQYSDIIKQYLKHKRLKEAVEVLEVRMLKEDRVQPNNYIYNILIGACAEVGYTKKAFKLYNDMKRRALQASGDTYTCLFDACANSPWAIDGLKNANNLRNHMLEKGVEPNLTNYNAMIKAFGRCGDLATAFRIVDEMRTKKIKIRSHTFNHLLQACISDKQMGLRHALVVWRKMLRLREKPNIYSFNLMLKCVKECNLGSKEDIEELIEIIQKETPLAIIPPTQQKTMQIESANSMLDTPENFKAKTMGTNQPNHDKITQMESAKDMLDSSKNLIEETNSNVKEKYSANHDKFSFSNHIEEQLAEDINTTKKSTSTLVSTNNQEKISIEFVEKLPAIKNDNRTVPNWLSKTIKMDQVLSLQEVATVQDKFAIVGGQEDFFKEMEAYSIKPDIKTCTQILALLDDNIEAEEKLLATMKAKEIKADIDFYNMLIKKRCFRSDYENAVAVKDFIEKEDKVRKRRYPNNKKRRLKPNVMTYGVLALACRTRESAEKLLSEMRDKQLKVNVHILGTLLRHGTAHKEFGYVVYVMKMLKEENIPVNDIFLKHLEEFNEKCIKYLEKVDENGKPKISKGFEMAYKKFSSFYSKWLRDIDIKNALEPEHPWQQFTEDAPETLQRPNYKIVEPRKYYKRDRRFVKYVPKL